jgi:hypothetical protein
MTDKLTAELADSLLRLGGPDKLADWITGRDPAFAKLTADQVPIPDDPKEREELCRSLKELFDQVVFNALGLTPDAIGFGVQFTIEPNDEVGVTVLLYPDWQKYGQTRAQNTNPEGT